MTSGRSDFTFASLLAERALISSASAATSRIRAARSAGGTSMPAGGMDLEFSESPFATWAKTGAAAARIVAKTRTTLSLKHGTIRAALRGGQIEWISR